MHRRAKGLHGDRVTAVQTQFGYTDAHGAALRADGYFGPGTRAAVESFQRAQSMEADGIVGPATHEALNGARTADHVRLDDARHAGNGMYMQALQNVHALDAQFGRTPDQLSVQFAGALGTTAHQRGLTRIDQVALSEDGSRAFAVQNEINSPARQIADVNVNQSVAKPLEQSSAEFQRVSHQQDRQPDPQQTPPPILQPSEPQRMRHP